MKKAFLSLALCLLATAVSAQSISLKGSTGKEVAFTGIKDATPKGITAQMKADGPIIGIPWEKLDLKDLETNQPEIYEAYTASKGGDTVALNLGSYGDPAMNKPPESKKKDNGWFESSARGVTWMLQLPAGKLRGVLIIAHGDRGNAFRMILGMDQGTGLFGPFQNKHGFALMSYRYTSKMQGPTDIDDFVFAGKGSGQGVLDALERMAKTAGKPELADAPIAIYGFGKVGAPFAFNFTQWKPERVVAAVAARGAFYQGEPSEASAKVPMMIIWGQYDRSPEMWNSENDHLFVFNEYADLNPNWTHAMEFRGSETETQEGDFFGRKFLHDMIELRVPKVQPKAAKPAPPVEGEETEAEEPAPEPEPEGPALIEIDRSESYVGNTETLEFSKMKKDQALGENETWLPDRDIARMWKDFAEGGLEVTE